MRGYGRDYDGRNWFARAEDTVRGWFGGGPSYDRDYPATRPRSDWGHSYNAGGMWERGPDRGGYRTNNWNNQHANWETVDRAGGYYGADYDRPMHARGGMDYDRDYGRDFDRELGHDVGRDMGWRSRRGMRGGYGGMGGGTSGGFRGTGGEYGGGYSAGGGWGDYSGGGYGGDRWRNSTSGGVQPGRYFRGYGNGSTGGSGYEPY